LQLYIIPTYNCNLECDKCYSKKYKEDFTNYLSWTKFVEIFKFFESNYKNFAIIGGEPTKWKFINESILFLHNRNKNVAIFTNATIPLKVIPNNLIINGNNIFNPELKDSIIRNLTFYRKKGVKIRLRFNIDEKFEKENIQEAILLSEQFADSVSISILYPIDNGIDYGNIIFDLSRKLYSDYIPVKISRATPLCLFNQEQRDFLISNCKLKGKCSLPNNSLVINPDGQTIQPCVELRIRRDISDLLKNKPKNIFFNDINTLKSNQQSTKCNNCPFHSNDECWGGCLSYPFFGAPLNVPPE
jgi:MoaA/NifB/PqqE/SkfB family radical SAM enzyme